MSHPRRGKTPCCPSIQPSFYDPRRGNICTGLCLISSNDDFLHEIKLQDLKIRYITRIFLVQSSLFTCSLKVTCTLNVSFLSLPREIFWNVARCVETTMRHCAYLSCSNSNTVQNKRTHSTANLPAYAESSSRKVGAAASLFLSLFFKMLPVF